jgi:glucose-6-phosphate-specific signal transduction histidine kinase
LLAITKKLERAANSDDEVAGRRLIEQLGSLINRSISEDFSNLHSTPKERIRQVIDNWQGIIEIQIENVDEIFKNEAKSLLATQLIEELVSNMAKHSDESRILIRCSNRENNLRLEVEPFYNLESFDKPGLGANILNSFVVTPEIVSKDRKQQTAIFEI